MQYSFPLFISLSLSLCLDFCLRFIYLFIHLPTLVSFLASVYSCYTYIDMYDHRHLNFSLVFFFVFRSRAHISFRVFSLLACHCRVAAFRFHLVC